MSENTKIDPALEQRAVNTIRALTIDAVEASGDGHPGMPMGAAAMGYTLFTRAMRYNPKNSKWPNRDRYVQSAGHGSMLQYSLLHLAGFDLSMDDLRNYRQWESRTPGHPEYGHTDGVETTTGPLGQGIATAVGMALAEAHLAERYNKPGYDVVDHHTYVIASDGDLMEGVASEASSLAGHLGLGKLIVLYDDNGISIDGATGITFTEDVLKRYKAYGWHTHTVMDGNDVQQLADAIAAAKAVADKPSIIAVRTVIGYGSPDLAGTSKVHGSPLGAKEAALTKENLGVDWPAFSVPDDVLALYRQAVPRGAQAEAEWQELFEGYRAAHPELAAEFERVMAGELPADLSADMPVFKVGESVATRKASNVAMNALAKKLPELVGGSADLAGSNYTDIDGETAMAKGTYGGRIIHFGIREHGMAAVANGLTLHGGLRAFVATFLIFSDYLRPALRLSALMHQGVVYVFTHDSVGLGGDGPTHQPIGELMALRLIPNLRVIRPADANETAQAWALAIESTDSPTALALTRQNVPNLAIPAGGVRRGAYVLAEAGADGGLAQGAAGAWTDPAQAPGVTPDVILIGTGSEVQLCLGARDQLEAEGIRTRVVSMPSFELFEDQDEEYRDAVLPPSVRARVAVEAGATLGWERWVGAEGQVIGIDRFGASAPGDVVMREFGFTVENVVSAARKALTLRG
ncbi:MAG: transketolase [Trueperaceae bacterium]